MNRIEWNRNSTILDSMFQAIGRTPLVRLKRILDDYNIKSEILCKIEFTNPTGSIKDRIYYQMITKAIQTGALRHDMEIVEASTGNAGISCAFVGRMLGYRVTIIMPEGMSEERKKLMRSLGAEIITTPGAESDIDLCIEKLRMIIERNPGRFWHPDQFTNPDNVSAHFNSTGPEIWEQTQGHVDCFLASQGTGGTLTGTGRYLKERNPSILLYAVEPSEAPMLSRREWGTHDIEGIGDGFVPSNLDLSQLTGVVTTSSHEAIDMSKKLAEEGILCGISSGCNVAAAVKVAKTHPELRRIVTIVNDSSQRYFSTALFDTRKIAEIPDRQHPVDEYTTRLLESYGKKWEIITLDLSVMSGQD